MKCSLVFLAILALGTAVPYPPKRQTADQTLLRKHLQIIQLLENIAGEIPNTQLLSIGQTYDIESHIRDYDNPSLVKLAAAAVKTGNVQPKRTAFSLTVSGLRQEVIILTRILLGAKDWDTFLNTAAWARVHLNEYQFVVALISAVLQRTDTQGIILPPLYEIIPQSFFDARVIQQVRDMKQTGIRNLNGNKDIIIPINFTSHSAAGEHKIAYFTEDIGLNSWYTWMEEAGSMIFELDTLKRPGLGSPGYVSGTERTIGHGAQWIYLQQQFLARYNLERLGNGLGPIPELNLKLVDIPLRTHMSYLNGLEMPGRPEGPTDVTGMRQELTKLVNKLEKRIIDAIEAGYIITPKASLLSLFQPQGLNMLGNLIEGSGKSINPRYYGSLLRAFKVLLGGTPEYSNIWEYTPSALELSSVAARDPALYVLLKRINKLFLKYQESLPAYQYNDIVLPGVRIQKVDCTQLITYFQDYTVNLDNAGTASVNEKMQYQQQQHQQQQGKINIKGLLKRLAHKPYDIEIIVQSQKSIPNAVVRVYLGPKLDHKGLPIDLNTKRMDFVELDQWVVDLVAGQNVITRNSRFQSIQSMDHPSVDQILTKVERAIQTQNSLLVTQPQELFSFPARLSLPKGTYSGFPLQLLVVISAGQQPVHYGPVIPEEVNSFQSNQYQAVAVGQYAQMTEQSAKGEGFVSIDVVPELDEMSAAINEGKWKWDDLYNKYQGYHSQPQWLYLQQTSNVGQGVEQGLGVGGDFGHGLSGQGMVGGRGIGEKEIPEGFRGSGLGGLSGVVDQQWNGGVREGGISVGLNGDFDPILPVEIHLIPGGQGGVSSAGSGGFGGIGGEGVSSADWKSANIVQQYYNKLPISQVIGGAISLDGKPLGWPLDRPLGPSAWSVPNMACQDVLIFHQDVPVTHVVGVK
ncbi:hexamerin-like [Belonocnema kinseyi]|uniref:hexamerin-like n=1 Tax=Belonocnema kinseyi TaxID=2817044 RepID=UPI00143DDDA5|nr:hexamerin-like [Belonocnema kinseyi]XP_033209435.1 hexamerin-like [Belonocnema kinseyi]